MTDTSPRRYSLLNATLNITHKDAVEHTPASVLAWVSNCLNCNTNFAEVTISQPTAFLCWPDFLDAPGFGPEHPDYPSSVEILRKVEHWLTLDRKELISALQSQHKAAESVKSAQRRMEEENALNGKKAKALDKLIAELARNGFGANDPINGGDCVEMVDRIYQNLVKKFPARQPAAS